VAAAAAKGGAGPARGRMVARSAVAVTCWLHPSSSSSSVMCSRLLRRADLFALWGLLRVCRPRRMRRPRRLDPSLAGKVLRCVLPT